MGNASGKPISFSDQVNLNHFRLLRVVGKGAFGKVRIVERKDTGLTFALKYIRKDEVVRSESVRNIIRERRMLEHLNHPFLCNLRYSFQDIEYLYIIVDLMNGGDLRFHISRKAFTEDAVCFWMAELGCALRYIHSQGVIHRDLKPDNVLLDGDGHVHLADFNVASEYKSSKPLHSKSGTLAYLAPEVYAGTGYTNEVDWWSLGVTFYECIYNKRPFTAQSHDRLAVDILRGSPAYPLTQPAISPACLDSLKSLLQKDRSLRIGAAGFHTFTRHPFFAGIDFDQLEKKQVPPVFVPASDKTNFDATYDLEELLLEEAPLEARARRQKPRGQLKEDATEKEIRVEELHRTIETLFEPFDYTKVTDYKGFVDGPSEGNEGISSIDILDKRATAATQDLEASSRRDSKTSVPEGSLDLKATSSDAKSQSSYIPHQGGDVSSNHHHEHLNQSNQHQSIPSRNAPSEYLSRTANTTNSITSSASPYIPSQTTFSISLPPHSNEPPSSAIQSSSQSQSQSPSTHQNQYQHRHPQHHTPFTSSEQSSRRPSGNQTNTNSHSHSPHIFESHNKQSNPSNSSPIHPVPVESKGKDVRRHPRQGRQRGETFSGNSHAASETSSWSESAHHRTNFPMNSEMEMDMSTSTSMLDERSVNMPASRSADPMHYGHGHGHDPNHAPNYGYSIGINAGAANSKSQSGPGQAAQGQGSSQKPSAVRGFLSRKKGRDRSPKAQKPQEPGVLGKGGARAIIAVGK